MMQAFLGFGVLLICSHHAGFALADEDCQPKAADIYVGIDTSGSIDYQTFLNVKTYLNTLIKNMHIRPDSQWVKFMTFGTTVSPDYDWIKDVDEAEKVIDNLEYHNSTSAYHKCFVHGNDQLIRYSRDLLTTPKVFVLIGDGKPTKLNAAQQAAESVTANGIVVVTQAYSSESNTDRLSSYAYNSSFATVKEINSGWEVAMDATAKAICKATNIKPISN